MAAESQRVVRYSSRADDDLVDVYEHTVHHHGVRQAEKYIKYLTDHAEDVVKRRALVKKMDCVDDVYLSFVKWSGAYYGHYIVFRYEDSGICVLRVIHSAADGISRRLELD